MKGGACQCLSLSNESVYWLDAAEVAKPGTGTPGLDRMRLCTKPLLHCVDNCSWHEWDLNWVNLVNSSSRFECASIFMARCWGSYRAQVWNVTEDHSPLEFPFSNYEFCQKCAVTQNLCHSQLSQNWSCKIFNLTSEHFFSLCKLYSIFSSFTMHVEKWLGQQEPKVWGLSEGRVFKKYKFVLV